MSPHARPIVLGGDYVYVANTPSDTVDVIHAKTREVVKRIPVGIDPVGLAIRPDGKELWVTSHISDSVSDRYGRQKDYLSSCGRNRSGL